MTYFHKKAVTNHLLHGPYFTHILHDIHPPLSVLYLPTDRSETSHSQDQMPQMYLTPPVSALLPFVQRMQVPHYCPHRSYVVHCASTITLGKPIFVRIAGVSHHIHKRFWGWCFLLLLRKHLHSEACPLHKRPPTNYWCNHLFSGKENGCWKVGAAFGSLLWRALIFWGGFTKFSRKCSWTIKSRYVYICSTLPLQLKLMHLCTICPRTRPSSALLPEPNNWTTWPLPGSNSWLKLKTGFKSNKSKKNTYRTSYEPTSDSWTSNLTSSSVHRMVAAKCSRWTSNAQREAGAWWSSAPMGARHAPCATTATTSIATWPKAHRRCYRDKDPLCTWYQSSFASQWPG